MQQNTFKSIFLWVLRIAVGGLFIFSGLIKANDPNGLSYKMQEFFEVWARNGYLPKLMGWLSDYTLQFSIGMIIAEIVAGIAIIIGYRFKWFAYFIFLLTAFFTFLTAYVKYSGEIKECGCFGDCIKLTPNETFTKDIILMVLISVLLLFKNSIADVFSKKLGSIILVTVFLASLLMQLYVLKHLPFKDCLGYKKGNNINEEMAYSAAYKPAVIESKYQYKNLKTGKTELFDGDKLPWQDSLTWKYDTVFAKVISEAQNEPKIKDFKITSFDGEDITQKILTTPGYTFLLIAKDLATAHTGDTKKLKQLVDDCTAKNIPFVGLCANDDIAANEFNTKNNVQINFAQLDNTVCKTAMRANLGIMLLKDGTVVDKWSYADYPTCSSVIK